MLRFMVTFPHAAFQHIIINSRKRFAQMLGALH